MTLSAAHRTSTETPSPQIKWWVLLAFLLVKAGTVMAVDAKRLLRPLPAKYLSEYGLYLHDMTLTPDPELVPFDLASPLFTDYALKFRYAYLPAGKSARVHPGEVLDFPVGTVLVKSFGYSKDLRLPDEGLKLVETRLLIHQSRGWVALAYVWDDQQKDAVLAVKGHKSIVSFVDHSGESQQIPYQVPTKEQCLSCHRLNGKTAPIGPKARNMNRTFRYPEGEKEQLTYWQERGYLELIPDHAAIPRLGEPRDADFTLEQRARAYLDINCAHCHREEGSAANTELFLRWEEEDPSRWGLRKAAQKIGSESGGATYLIFPGNPEQSVLWYRMQNTDPGTRMPKLGNTLVHKEGLELIYRWISSMEP